MLGSGYYIQVIQALTCQGKKSHYSTSQKWVKVGRGELAAEFRWVQVDSGEFRWISSWIQVSSGGFRWVQMDSGGFRWVQVDCPFITNVLSVRMFIFVLTIDCVIYKSEFLARDTVLYTQNEATILDKSVRKNINFLRTKCKFNVVIHFCLLLWILLPKICFVLRKGSPILFHCN